MKKAERIERYGLERYEQLVERIKARQKDRYANDLNYRLSEKIRSKTRYVKDGRIDLIENYELAVKDNLKCWYIHHRHELHPDYTVRFTRQSLIKLNLYYDRPPSELVWLRETEHNQIHHKGKVKK